MLSHLRVLPPVIRFLLFPASRLEVTRHNQHNEMLPRNRKTARFFPEQVLLMHRFLRIGFFNRSRWKALDLRPYCRPTSDIRCISYRNDSIVLLASSSFREEMQYQLREYRVENFRYCSWFIRYLLYVRMTKAFTLNNSDIIKYWCKSIMKILTRLLEE